MRIAPINTFHTVSRQNNDNLIKRNPQSQPAFGSFYNDLDDDPANGYSILDLFNWLRGGKRTYSKAEEEEFTRTWDPELGDISDIVDTNKPPKDPMEDYESGRLDELIKQAEIERAIAKEKAEEPPSVINYTEE